MRSFHSACSSGLSPLARGTRIQRGDHPARCRFIPAGAGNTHSRQMVSTPDAVYPRWRGEHDAFTAVHPGFIGLSPLARGTRFRRSSTPDLRRFIPAGAGNTCSRAGRDAGGCGLSPLARGTPGGKMTIAIVRRFIPAGAGNTAYPMALERQIAVYPRWRGEHLTSKAAPISGGGLSPLARGTHKPPGSRYNTSRFIPAGAGNTRICMMAS